MAGRDSVMAQTWRPSFHHSAGALGSVFLRALRDGRLIGWKTERFGVTIPPLEAGVPGEWVEIGPGATLVGCAPPQDLDPGDVRPGAVFGAVKVDGADSLLYALIECDEPGALKTGSRLTPTFPAAADGGTALPSFQLRIS